jgi:hypothetical protein
MLTFSMQAVKRNCRYDVYHFDPAVRRARLAPLAPGDPAAGRARKAALGKGGALCRIFTAEGQRASRRWNNRTHRLNCGDLIRLWTAEDSRLGKASVRAVIHFSIAPFVHNLTTVDQALRRKNPPIYPQVASLALWQPPTAIGNLGQPATLVHSGLSWASAPPDSMKERASAPGVGRSPPPALRCTWARMLACWALTSPATGSGQKLAAEAPG